MKCWLFVPPLLLSINIVYLDKLLVNSKVGLIRGLQAKDGDYRMFLGIPYAVVNKSNPFGESIPYPYFDTIFDAYDDSAMCPQLEEFNYTIVGSLDCLRLNIYVPNSKYTSEEHLPVLIFIHGGYFKIGFSGRYMYGPKYLVRHDIILVTLNYRLGPYGFFCLDTPEVSGNQGFKDQKRAFKWIYNNIAEFGGDPDRITFSGNSLGATSVDFILHSIDDEERIFDKAIIQSHSFSPGGEIFKPDNKDPLRLTEYLGYKTDIISNALTYMATVDPKKVIEASINLNMKYGLCLEITYDNVKTFISDNVNYLSKPKVQNMSVFIGNTDREMLFKYNVNDPTYRDNYDPFKEYVGLFEFEEKIGKDNMEYIFRQFYIGDNAVNAEVRNDLICFSCDAYYLHAAKRIMAKYIENGIRDVYYYIFSYNGNRNFKKLLSNITDQGASHADDLGYLFEMAYFNKSTTIEDQLIIDRLTMLWANFVKYGNPTPVKSTLLPIKWIPYTKKSQHYIKIDTDITLEYRPFHWRMAFWDLWYKLMEIYRSNSQEKTNQLQ